jgi:CHAT domain-containing protein
MQARGPDPNGSPLVRPYSIPVSWKILTKKVEELHDGLLEGSIGFDIASAKLFQLLLGLAAPALKGMETLIFVPDDVLWEVPFQALKDETGHYLIEKRAIFYAPSLTALREMRQRKLGRISKAGISGSNKSQAPDSMRTLLAFGDPVFSSRRSAQLETGERNEVLYSLPTTKLEVNTLREIYGPLSSAAYVGSQATEEKAKSEIFKYRVLHFATHGILDETNPLYSRIVLLQPAATSSEDGFLEAREIMKMDLNADLAVLSACQTARGRISRGEGVIGLNWGLFAAGCPTTVVSQWNVEANSTSRLMIDFHSALLSINRDADHVSRTAEALRQAALKMLKSPDFSRPIYWAGFIVVGDGW